MPPFTKNEVSDHEYVSMASLENHMEVVELDEDGLNAVVVGSDKLEPVIEVQEEIVCSSEDGEMVRYDMEAEELKRMLEMGERTQRPSMDELESKLDQLADITMMYFASVNTGPKRPLELSDGRVKCSPKRKICVRCPQCDKTYSSRSNLTRHKQTHRSLNDDKAKTCPICGKVYVSMPAYAMHLRTHNQSYKCLFCDKKFSRSWLMQVHLRIHTGEKPFKCNVCEKPFSDRSNLRAHVQTHSNVKPYACENCGKNFALKIYLNKHKDLTCNRKVWGDQYHNFAALAHYVE